MSNQKSTCPICGKPSFLVYGKYPRKDKLCKDCSQKLFNKEIEQCPNCGKWNRTGKICACKFKKIKETVVGFFSKTEKQEPSKDHAEPIQNTTSEENKIITINGENKSKCLTCGRNAEGLLFCTSCYHKYKNKELLFKITNCSNVELLDEDYEGKFTCKDGHIVKSKSEREIDNYLFEHNIPHAYERELPYGGTAKETLHPDFYLPHYLGQDKHVYIEHWGYNENNISYTKTKKFKLPIYKQLNITLVCTNEKSDIKDIDATLDRKLNKSYIKEGEINFDE